MNLKEEISDAFKSYLRAIFTSDYQSIYDCLYEPDAESFRETILEFSHKMDQFGETEDFLKQFGFSNIQQLEQLSLFDFMSGVFKLITREIGKGHLDKILSETVITSIEETEYFSLVSYEYPIHVFDEWETHHGQVQMIKSENEWKLFFKSGMEAGLTRYQDEIDRFFHRKDQDNLDNFRFEGDLIKFSLVGYKDFMTGKVVFEPRFKDAGDFSEGLAPVQIMRKYGYIDVQGEIVIKPQFLEAKEFSHGLAAVKAEDKNGDAKWGFIDNTGNMSISVQYTNTSSFNEELCAVEIDGKWGYLNTKGELVIPNKFDVAGDFSYGSTYVEIYNENDEPIEFLLDTDGNITEVT